MSRIIVDGVVNANANVNALKDVYHFECSIYLMALFPHLGHTHLSRSNLLVEMGLLPYKFLIDNSFGSIHIVHFLLVDSNSVPK